MIKIYALCFTSFLLNSRADCQSIDNYLQAAGGKENLEKVSNTRIVYQIQYFSDDDMQPKKYTVTKVVDTYGRYYSESYREGHGIRLVKYDGVKMKEYLRNGFTNTLSAVERKEYEMREIHLGEPWIVLNADAIKYLGQLKVSEDSCYAFRITNKGFNRIFYIRKADSMLNEISLFDNVSHTVFSDYRVVKNFKLPFKYTSYINNKVELTTTIISIEFNIRLPISIFEVD